MARREMPISLRNTAERAFTMTPSALKFVDYAESREKARDRDRWEVSLYYARKCLITND